MKFSPFIRQLLFQMTMVMCLLCLSVVLQKKPDPNLCGVKRKAVTPVAEGVGELPFAGIKKKPKEEWSCALCQVSATSERGLNEHLQGRRHKAKEAGLRAQKMARNPNKASLPKETTKTAKIGAYSEMVMEAHKKGKKHLVRLQKSSQNSEAVQADKKAKDSESGAEGPKDSEVGVKETEDSEFVAERATDSGLAARGANTERTETAVANADEPRPPSTITMEEEGVHQSETTSNQEKMSK
ncbi:hypothetical protein D5086_013289 [Populus alba]|uniref:Uncharacterized protein n=1 Tax=Populus alba TaxID=43335 RepID=A0ACC4C5U4_POPAL